jgi:hypothetical protein
MLLSAHPLKRAFHPAALPGSTEPMPLHARTAGALITCDWEQNARRANPARRALNPDYICFGCSVLLFDA